jgi:transposase InsO family protein
MLEMLAKLKSERAPSRTLRYWKEKIKQHSPLGISAASILVPRWANCGNRTPRIVGQRAEFLAKFIAEHYPADFRIPTQRSYVKYRHAAKAFHPNECPVGIEAFKERVHADPVARAEAIGGKRAAHQAQASSDVDHRTLRPQRAFELAHIDHHLADIHLCVKVNGKRLFTIRIWLTVMVDAFSGAVLSFWISAKAPSRRACAMVLRRCLRIHKRLPENIITDHGAEFESTYFSALLAFCGICKKDRPAGHPRFGSEAERLFQLFISYYTSTRPGRIRSVLEGRGISKSHSSEVTAQLTPELFIDEVAGFFDWYNTVNITNDAEAPRLVTLNENSALFGCCGIAREYDQQFIMASAVETGEYIFDPGRGIQTANGWFFDSSVCKLAGRRRRKLITREDPEFPHRLYVFLDSQWRVFRNTGDQLFELRTENQRLAAALRFNDGRSAKMAQREYANGVLIDRMAENDKLLGAPAAIETPKPKADQKPIRNSIFLQARKMKVKVLSTLPGRTP